MMKASNLNDDQDSEDSKAPRVRNISAIKVIDVHKRSKTQDRAVDQASRHADFAKVTFSEIAPSAVPPGLGSGHHVHVVLRMSTAVKSS